LVCKAITTGIRGEDGAVAQETRDLVAISQHVSDQV
jgi:hypothetical protein